MANKIETLSKIQEVGMSELHLSNRQKKSQTLVSQAVLQLLNLHSLYHTRTNSLKQ